MAASPAEGRKVLDRQVVRVRAADARQTVVGRSPREASSWCWGAHGLQVVVGDRAALRYARPATRTADRVTVIRRADPRAVGVILDPTCRFSFEALQRPRGEELLAFRSPLTAPLTQSSVPGGHPFGPPAWSPDGRFAAVVPTGGEARRGRVVVETATGRVVATLPATPSVDGFSAQAFSPDGAWLASSDDPFDGGKLDILDLATGATRTVAADASPLDGRAGWGSPSWSPDGRTLAAVHVGGLITLIDVATGARSTITPRWFPTSPPLWSPDGGRLAYLTTGGDESKVGVEIASVAPGGAQPRLARLRPWSQINAGPFWTPDSSGVVIVKG